MTEKRIDAIVERAYRLCRLAEEFLQETEKTNKRIAGAEVFIRGGALMYEYNDSCHCHPSYISADINKAAFVEWLANRETKNTNKT